MIFGPSRVLVGPVAPVLSVDRLGALGTAGQPLARDALGEEAFHPVHLLAPVMRVAVLHPTWGSSAFEAVVDVDSYPLGEVIEQIAVQAQVEAWRSEPPARRGRSHEAIDVSLVASGAWRAWCVDGAPNGNRVVMADQWGW